MKKLYVLISKQLDPSYRAVQAGHAVAEYLIKTPNVVRHCFNKDDHTWQNETLVYVLSDDIEKDYHVLSEMGFDLHPFHEPDMDNALTAFACYSDHRVFQRYEMN